MQIFMQTEKRKFWQEYTETTHNPDGSVTTRTYFPMSWIGGAFYILFYLVLLVMFFKMYLNVNKIKKHLEKGSK